MLAMAGALLAHISINALNEVHDFRTGLDFKTQRTPFSGGSGVLPGHPELAGSVLLVGVSCAVAIIGIGAFFIRAVGWGIVPVGLAGLCLVLGYSSFITKRPWICLLAPGIGFGVLIVTGTAYLLRGNFQLLPFVAALVPFFLCNNLLLLNQFPDIEADRSVGRRGFPIVYGVKASACVYGVFLLGSTLTIISGVLAGLFPLLALSALVSLPFGLVALRGAVMEGAAVARFPVYLACNAGAAVIAPLLLGLALLIGPDRPSGVEQLHAVMVF